MGDAVCGGEVRCRVCGLFQDEPIWGVDGRSPTYNICPCCGCEFGYWDCLPDKIQEHRREWLAKGAKWFDPAARPEGWNVDDQLAKVPNFYFRVLPGLPGTGPDPVRFNVTGTDLYAEGFVVEFTNATGERWVGNFKGGLSGKSTVLSVPGRTDRAIVLAQGLGYVVEPHTRALVRTFGGQIEDVFYVPGREVMIFGNGLWFECEGPEGQRWRTRRISWDGMMDVSLHGMRLHGRAFDPMNDSWCPFDLDVATGEVTGGSYPPELP